MRVKAQDVKPGTRVILPGMLDGETVIRTVATNHRHFKGDFRGITFIEVPGWIFPFPVLREFDVSMDTPLPFPEV